MFAQRSVHHVVSLRCGSDVRSAALSSFGVVTDKTNDLPIVLLPSPRHIKMLYIIPDGCACIVQKNGVDLGEWEPGRHLANFEHQVVFVVTKQACAYEYDIVSCPTKDNVMVEVGITFVFNINHPALFCYKLGAYNFDDLLQSVAEESIRNIVRNTAYNDVYELRSLASEQLQQMLNISFKSFGVVFSSVTVTSVTLPHDLVANLSDATRIQAQLKEHHEMVEFRELKISSKADRRLTKYSTKQERLLANLSARKERTAIVAQTKIEECKRKHDFKLLQLNEEINGNITRAKASLRDAQVTTQAKAEEILQTARNKVKNMKASIDQYAAEGLMKSETELTEVSTELNTYRKLASANEGEARKKEREHQVELKRIEAIKALAQQGHIVLSGESGQKVIDMFAF